MGFGVLVFGFGIYGFLVQVLGFMLLEFRAKVVADMKQSLHHGVFMSVNGAPLEQTGEFVR